jgi:hypothetical protein
MIFPAIRSAILRCTGVSVSQVFASTDQVAVEFADLANEVATDIMKSHDWRALTKVAQVVGDGSLAYPLPADYDRMVLASSIENAQSWFWGYEPFYSVNDWLLYKSGLVGIQSPGGWIIIGGELQFYPAPNGVAEYPYISNQYARDASGNPAGAFASDADSFVLDNRLLTLGLIWRWNEQKGQEYSEALATYEAALAQAQARDKGSRPIRSGGHVSFAERQAGRRLP